MKIYKNNTKGPLRFGRFRLAVDEQVPAVPYTENEEKDIVRFAALGILECVGEQGESSVEPEVTEVTEPVAEPEVVEVPEQVEAPAPKKAPKKEKQA